MGDRTGAKTRRSREEAHAINARNVAFDWDTSQLGSMDNALRYLAQSPAARAAGH